MLRAFTFALIVSVPVLASTLPLQTIGVTPHYQYSSSIGVIGCKINTNRVAYWPSDVTCNNICVSLSYKGRSLYLLKIDKSGGAYDISYDAWNYLVFGKSAMVEPHQGGAFDMQYEFVSAEHCKHLLHNGMLPLSAPTSMNYVVSCLGEKGSWVPQNYKLFNIFDSTCRLGWDEECKLDLAVSNQPACPRKLGDQPSLATLNVTNIQYGTGISIVA